jgi:serine/threonine-protein kinase HipA
MLAALAVPIAREFPHYLECVLEDVLRHDAAAQPFVLNLALSGTEEFRLDAATALAQAGREDSLSQARGILRDLAHSAHSGRVRFAAAIVLRGSGSPSAAWKDVLIELARGASEEDLRLDAAKTLADAALIRAIAGQTQKPWMREKAQQALETLRLHRTLLQVGRRRRGSVSLDGVPVGSIEETAYGTRFTYDRNYVLRQGIPISPTLPLREEPFESQGLHPFFDNLLPEGWLLDLTCQKLGLDRTDAFGLLLATCADCAGAVEVTPEQQAA